MEKAEIGHVKHTDLVAEFDKLIGAQQSITKYRALNLQTNITIDKEHEVKNI
jgi:hypothetical protein